VGKIRALLRRIPGRSEFIILDMPPGREAVDVLGKGMEALLVVNPDKASVLDALNMKVLLERKGTRILGAVLNRAEDGEEWIEEIERVLETKVVAVIPESRVVKEAYEREECFVAAAMESEPSREIMALAEELVGMGREEAVEEKEEVGDERGGYGFEGLVEKIKGVIRWR
jgi:septum site-determining protein MinD